MSGVGRAELVATWQQLAALAGPLRTLDPARELATPLVEVHARALVELPAAWRSALAEPLAAGLIELALAQLDAFPGNLFWDLDLIACDIAREVARETCASPSSASTAATIERRLAEMSALQTLYGRASAINFSFVHDFVYGYDWVKWRSRSSEASGGPFGPVFLRHMDRRGHELLELIARDDHEYPQLPEQEPRNPFPFSRAPADELRLHRELARRGLIPVPTWSATIDTSALDWSRPWQAERVELAIELGLA